MKRKLAAILVVVAATVVATFSSAATTTRPALAASGIGPGTKWPVVGYPPNEATDNVILKWDERLLESIRANPRLTGPTVAARALGILHSATYDAWAAFQPASNGAVDSQRRLQKDPTLRHPELASPVENKEKAISYAAYQVLINLFPSRKAIFDGYMIRAKDAIDPGPGLGYGATFDIEKSSYDLATPAGIGNKAADAVLTFRASDGSNQKLNPDNTVTYPYSCLPQAPECYNPDNHNRWNDLQTPWHWQPLCVLTGVGVAAGDPIIRDPNSTCPDAAPPNNHYALQGPLHPQWPNVKPFGPLTDKHYPPQFTLPGPPTDGADIDLELRDTSNLSETQKAKADYWADGPLSEFPPGHMAVFAQALSRMRKNTLDQDVKLFFVLGNAVMDSSISAWAAKYQFDSWRPISAIRYRYKNQKVNSWLGPGKGYGTVLGQNWLPYQEPTVVTPSFPEYVSGHSTFSAAGRTVLLQFYNNSDAFNASVVIPKGKSRIEPNVTPSKDITITWKTLSDASDDAGWSRRWGGIHFYSGDQQGRTLGRLIGYNDWNLAQKFFTGTVTDEDLKQPVPPLLP